MSLKKTIVSGAAALAIMGTAAAAMQLATDGTGDYLISPVYYGVGNFKTDLKVVNTNTTNAVVAKVIVRGGKESKELVDFALYLTPGDVWTGKIYQDSDGDVYIESHDDSLMFGMKEKTITVPDKNASGKCDNKELKIITPIVSGTLPGGKVDLTERASAKNDEARRGYVEVIGVAAYDPNKILDVINKELNVSKFTWNEGCEFNKTLFYTGIRILDQKYDINVSDDLGAHKPTGADLTGEQVIYATATDDKDKRFMKLPMLAIEDAHTQDLEGDGVLKSEYDLGDTGSITQLHTILNKKHVYVLYDGNEDQTDIVPTQVIFTYPYMNIAEYNLSAQTAMLFRDMSETAAACKFKCTSGFDNGCTPTSPDGNPEDELSGGITQTTPCPVKTITDEVGIVFDHDPTANIKDPYISKYAFTTGGYVDINLTNVPVAGQYSTDNGLPVIPTTIMAKDIGGLYLNNHLYNPYNR